MLKGRCERTWPKRSVLKAQAIMNATLEAHQLAATCFARPSPNRGPVARSASWRADAQRPGHTRCVAGPAMANHLVHWWLDGIALPLEVRAERFKPVRAAGHGFQE